MKLTLEDKKEIVAGLKDLINSHQVIGILEFHSLPAKQLQQIKKELSSQAKIKMSRKTLIGRALAQSEKEGVNQLEGLDVIQPALIFSDSNPFQLFSQIKSKKTSAPASEGAIAPSDIEIKEGPTGLSPGPMIGKIQQLGADTKVEDGEIVVEDSSVAVASGEEISGEAVNVFNQLGMEPLEVGLDLKAVWEDGDIFEKSVLDIDVEDYRRRVKSLCTRAFNLLYNTKFVNEKTAVPLIQEAVNQAKALALNADILTADFVPDQIREAVAKSKALEKQVED